MVYKAYRKLEGNSNDLVGGNNGTDTSIAYGTDYGKSGQGAFFNNSTSRISCGSTGDLNTATFTIQVLFRTSKTTEQYIVTNSGENINSRWYVGTGISANKVNVYVQNKSSAGWHYSNQSVCDDKRHHLVVICSSTTIEIYVDGKQDKSVSSTGSALTTAQKTSIGIRNDSPLFRYPRFSGNIDNISYDDGVRTPAKIKNQYALFFGYM